MQRLSELDTSNPFEATVKESERITPASADEIRNIVLEIDDPSFEFLPGQSIGIIVPGPTEFGSNDHVRLYSIASGHQGETGEGSDIAICVKRCFYIDDFSGEKHQGVASNYLCDLKAGDKVRFVGPFAHAFSLPADDNANLLMVGMGTGIAPFRAFIKNIYEKRGGWKGKVRLFYGAKRGIDLAYMNDVNNDFAQYYDEKTFKAIEALSPRPALDAPVALKETIEQNADEVWSMVKAENTYVYIAGLQKVIDQFDAAMAKLAGSADAWADMKADLKQEGRWSELLY